MSKGTEEEQQTIYLRLLLGILPFDVDITIKAVRDLLSETEETSWPSVMRRSANLGLVLSTIGLIGIFVLLYPQTDLSNYPIESVGLVYRVAIAVVVLMWLAKFLIGLAQNIDTGDSPFIPRDQRDRITSFSEFLIGVSFVGMVSIPVYQLWSWEILVVIFFTVAAIGIAIAGVCLTISGAYGVISQSSNSKDEGTVSAVEKGEAD